MKPLFTPLALLLGLGIGSYAVDDASAETKQNVIVIMVDDVGANSFWLNKRRSQAEQFSENAPLPDMYKLVEGKGLIWYQGSAWAQPACTTTRVSRSTGTDPHHNGAGFAFGGPPSQRIVVDRGQDLLPGLNYGDTPLFQVEPDPGQARYVPLLQKLAQDHGYHTGKFGKSHENIAPIPDSLMNVPGGQRTGVEDVILSGFDVYYGQNAGGPTSGLIGPEFSPYGGALPWVPATNLEPYNEPTQEFVGSALVSRAIDFIKGTEAEGKNYLMMLDFPEPHWIPPNNAVGRNYAVAPGPEEPCPPGFEDSGHFTCKDDWEPYRIQGAAYSELIKEVKAAFGGEYPAAGTITQCLPEDLGKEAPCVQSVAGFQSLSAYYGRQIGRLMKHVDLENTTVIFSGDNGDQGSGNINDAGTIVEAPNDRTKAKSTLYAGGVEVPFMAWGKHVKKPRYGIRTRALVQTQDVYCTTLELLGIPQPEHSKESCFSFVSHLKGEKPTSKNRKYLIASIFPRRDIHGATPPQPPRVDNEGMVVSDGRYRLLLKTETTDDGSAYACDADWWDRPGNPQDPLHDCYDFGEDRFYKTYSLELYDIWYDKFEENNLYPPAVDDRKLIKKYNELCNAANDSASRGKAYNKGTVCAPIDEVAAAEVH